jgi:SAM-dependent methyltransferase
LTTPSGGIPNAYDDARRAAAYADLGFTGTYSLAFRDLPQLLAQHVSGTRALDFGCGAGRSTRFLQQLGFRTVGIDIAEPMLERARERDPDGTYLLVRDDAATGWPDGPFDLVLAAIRQRLAPHGRLLLIASAPELYAHEWLSFTTAWPENRDARPGDVVRIAIRDGGDPRPILDILWDDEAYRQDFNAAGLHVIALHRPVGQPGEAYAWVTELEVSPWMVYVCGG